MRRAPKSRSEIIAEFYALTAAGFPPAPGAAPAAKPAPPAAKPDPEADPADKSADDDVTAAIAALAADTTAAIAAQEKDDPGDPHDAKVLDALKAVQEAVEAAQTAQEADVKNGPPAPPSDPKAPPPSPDAPKAAPAKPAVPPAAATARERSGFAGPVPNAPLPTDDPPDETNAASSGDVPPDAICKTDGCGHLASSHEDTAQGENTGACNMMNCNCAQITVPDESPISDQPQGAPGMSARFADVPEDKPVDEALAPQPPAAAPAVAGIVPGQDDSGAGSAGPALPGGKPIGQAFSIPVGIMEGVETSDGRFIQPNALTWRTPPLPLMAMLTASHGYDSMADASVWVGYVESVTRDGNNITATGHLFADDDDATEFAAKLGEAGQFGISADVGNVTSILMAPEPIMVDGNPTFDTEAMPLETLTAGEIMGFTACPFPAFPGCYIILGDGTGPAPIPMKAPTADQARIGLHILTTEECEPCANGVTPLVASGAPTAPPVEWFETPEPSELMPLTVFEDGRVFGHMAGWGTCHTGRQGCVTPPRSSSGYAYFHTGYVLCNDGTEMPTGRITLDAMHAGTSLTLQQAMAHYDNTALAVANVHAVDGKLGIWLSGAMVPWASKDQFYKLRAAGSPSGDWRSLGRGHELVAALAVNSPGFPVPRATVRNGKVLSLVAAGAPEMWVLSHPDKPLTLEQRLARMERGFTYLAPTAKAELRERFARARKR
jgi:hypothetical protein